MSLLHEAFQEKLSDSRVVERNVARGALSADEAVKVESQLKDDSESAVRVRIDDLMAWDGKGKLK